MKKLIIVFAFLFVLFLSSKVFAEDKTINSLVFVSHEQEIFLPEEDIEIIDVFVPDEKEFKALLTPYIGQEITMDNLELIKQKVLNYYRKYGYYLVAVRLIPDQDITDGSIEYRVILSDLDKITVTGARYFSNEKIKKDLTLLVGKVVNNNEIIKNLWWINNNPFRSASVFFKEGEDFATSEIVFKVRDKRPFRVYGEYQNTGNLIAGDSRYTAGLNWGNVLGLNHQLNYQFITATSSKHWWAQTANYIIPLPWKHIFKAIGFYSETDPQSTELQGFSATGKAWQLSCRYEFPIIRKNFQHIIDFGYDFKRTNNALTFLAIPAASSIVDISQFTLGYQLTAVDRFGNNYLKVDGYFSPGRMTNHNKNSDFQDVRSGAKRTYAYLRLHYDRYTRLWKNFSWIVDFTGQIAAPKLLPTEELSFGGYTTIRGYKEYELIADHGFIIKNEIRTPSFPVFFRKRSIKDNFQFLFFVDSSWAFDIDHNVYTKNKKPMASIGPGMRYSYKENVTVRLDYGFQLININRLGDVKNDHSRLHAIVTIAF